MNRRIFAENVLILGSSRGQKEQHHVPSSSAIIPTENVALTRRSGLGSTCHGVQTAIHLLHIFGLLAD